MALPSCITECHVHTYFYLCALLGGLARLSHQLIPDARCKLNSILGQHYLRYTTNTNNKKNGIHVPFPLPTTRLAPDVPPAVVVFCGPVCEVAEDAVGVEPVTNVIALPLLEGSGIPVGRAVGVGPFTLGD